ncbi:MAG: hypothetical protein ACE5GB_02955 [Acidimicrobiales bacterium]
MATPLTQVLEEVLGDAADFRADPTAWLASRGWSSLEPADVHEALAIHSEALPLAEAVRLAPALAIDADSADGPGSELLRILDTVDAAGGNGDGSGAPDQLDDPLHESDDHGRDDDDRDPADIDAADSGDEPAETRSDTETETGTESHTDTETGTEGETGGEGDGGGETGGEGDGGGEGASLASLLDDLEPADPSDAEADQHETREIDEPMIFDGDASGDAEADVSFFGPEDDPGVDDVDTGESDLGDDLDLDLM